MADTAAVAALRGDLLALAGGVAMAGYFLLSREAQATVPFRAYLGIAYGVAAAVLWLAVLGCRRPGIPDSMRARGGHWRAWRLVSQLIGHSGYNWSLRYLSPLFVAVVSVGEPVLASLLAWWILGEALDGRTGAGGILILAAIACATLGARPRQA